MGGAGEGTGHPRLPFALPLRPRDLQDCRKTRASGRRTVTVNEIQVWHSVQVQIFNSDGGLRPPQQLFALPPSRNWLSGRCDTAPFRESVNPGSPQRPGPGLKG